MTVRVYRSTDAGSPTLAGTQGSLINVLSAVLTGPSFNGTGNAYGSTPCAGWSRPYTGTNKAAYQQPATANQRFLLIDETTNDANARVTGYETMTSITAANGPFPSAAQVANSQLFMCKSAANDSSARPWIIVATDKMFHMWVNNANTAPLAISTSTSMLTFGDFVAYATNDIWNTILIAATSSGASVNAPILQIPGLGTVAAGHYCPRSYSQTGTSVQMTKGVNGLQTGTGSSGSAGMVAPNPVDGKIYVAPIVLGELLTQGQVLRGELPGVFAILHLSSSIFNDGDVITSIANASGKTLELHYLYNSGQSGAILLETSNTW